MAYKRPKLSTSRFETNSEGIIGVLENELKCESDNSLQKQTKIYFHQIKAVLNTKEYFDAQTKDKRKPALIVAPTGSGKSGIVALLPYVLKSNKVLVITPSRVITEQIAREFGNEGNEKTFFYKTKLMDNSRQLTHVLESPKVVNTTKDISSIHLSNLVIVNAQKFGGKSNASIMKCRKRTKDEVIVTSIDKTRKPVKQEVMEVIVEDAIKTFEEFDTLIIDEAHHYPADTWCAIVKYFKTKNVVFLTATPYRKNKDGKKAWILKEDRIVLNIPKSDIEGVIRNSKFVEKDYGKNVYLNTNDKKFVQINTDIKLALEKHYELAKPLEHKAMVLVRTKTEAIKLAKHLDNATYHTSEKGTDKNLEDFEKGEFRTLVVCGKLLEGYDNSDVSVCVILRKVDSPIVYSQFVGRCLRFSRDKNYDFVKGEPLTAIILTYAEFKQREINDFYENPFIPETDVVVESDSEE